MQQEESYLPSSKAISKNSSVVREFSFFIEEPFGLEGERIWIDLWIMCHSPVETRLVLNSECLKKKC